MILILTDFSSPGQFFDFFQTKVRNSPFKQNDFCESHRNPFNIILRPKISDFPSVLEILQVTEEFSSTFPDSP